MNSGLRQAASGRPIIAPCCIASLPPQSTASDGDPAHEPRTAAASRRTSATKFSSFTG
ncbi:hypothetical protein [Methylobrevis pamukkalensis]|uniref:hypothetical protein n=1 Tax=Methylobrevis pamukkalensis TaxID=1439726 RepID=UPI001470A5D2